MINEKKELCKYKEIKLDNPVDIHQSELSATLNIFTKAFQRLGKQILRSLFL